MHWDKITPRSDTWSKRKIEATRFINNMAEIETTEVYKLRY